LNSKHLFIVAVIFFVGTLIVDVCVQTNECKIVDTSVGASFVLLLVTIALVLIEVISGKQNEGAN